MSENKLKEFLNQNYGYIKTKDFEKLGISRPSIQGYIDKKIINENKNFLFDEIVEDHF